MTQNVQTATKFFNLTTDGVGYLNTPRTFKKGKSEGLSVTVQALRGEQGENAKPETSRFDLDVVGKEAQKVIKKLMEKYPEILDYKAPKPTIFIGFTASDIRADSFASKNDAQKLIHSIKGRLLKVKFVCVNGETLYKAEPVKNELIELVDEVSEEPIAQDQPVQEVTEALSEDSVPAADLPAEEPESVASTSENAGFDKL